jgi:hypothetical protein
MNAQILNNLQAWQICNENKIVDQMKKKFEAEWDWLQIKM